MSGLILRYASGSDAPAMAKIEKASFPRPSKEEYFVRETEENPMARYMVAQCGDELAGYAGLWCILDEGHINNVAVDMKYRGRGIGTQIISKLIEDAEAEGIGRFTLEVRPSNEAALALYRKFGFREEGRRKKYYEDNGEDAIIMWRR